MDERLLPSLRIQTELFERVDYTIEEIQLAVRPVHEER